MKSWHCFSITFQRFVTFSSTMSRRSISQFTDEKQTSLYARFRPNYNDAVYQRMIKFCRQGDTEFQLAVDVGCGSGQSTIPLAKYFTKVIGSDVSEQQIRNAPTTTPNIEFRVSPGEDLTFLQSSCVDLVTVAQALHWMDRDKFFTDVDRVLRPGGSLIVYGYGQVELEPKDVNDYIFHMYKNVLGPYWAKGRELVEEKYISVSLPYPGWLRNDSLALKKECSISEFVGYLGSWSAVNNYSKDKPGDDILEVIENRLQTLCNPSLADEGCDECHPVLQVSWPVFMLMGRKPR